MGLLVHPGVGAAGVGADLGLAGEPQGDLLLGALHSVGAVDDVAEQRGEVGVATW